MNTIIWTIVTLTVLGLVLALILYFVAQKFKAVSYTHLTLPTNIRV